MKEDLMTISMLVEARLTKGIEKVKSRDGAPAAEVIYRGEEVTIAWPVRRADSKEWDYAIDPIPPGIEYIEYRDCIMLLYPNGKTDVLTIESAFQRRNYFPSQESWLETIA